MAETPRNERTQEGAADLLGAARDRGMEQLEGVKGQLAEGAERIASAVERTAEELDGEGDGAISGFGHSVTSLMRQLAGGLRERDVEEFARELSALARRNPGVFLAGSVALGFGIARFFKARAPGSSMGTSANSGDYGRRDTGGWQDTGGWNGSDASARGTREDFDADESLDLSAGSSGLSESSSSLESSQDSTTVQQATSRDDDRNPSKARQSGKHKAKSQRASSGGSQQAGAGSQGLSGDRSATEPSPTDSGGSGSGGSAFTGGTGGGALRGGKS